MLTLGINTKPKLSNETFRLLRDIIYARCGIFFADNKKYLLETRLARRLEEKNLKSFEDYYYFLTYDTEKEKELSNVQNSIVTNETSFFRDPAQLNAFIKGVVPKVIEGKAGSADRKVRVWSAASSTGEEPYTLAIMMLEEKLNLKGYSIEVFGSDISDVVLRSAESATYDKYTLRNMAPELIARYFRPAGTAFTLERRARELVTYIKINLVSSMDTRMMKGMDIIFCRNVLIYFDDTSKKKAVAHLYDGLAPGGYLFVGFSETLHNITRLFRPVSIERSVVYQKV